MNEAINEICFATSCGFAMLTFFGFMVYVSLSRIEFQLKRIAEPPKPIVKIQRFDKDGEALYEVDATVEIVRRDGSALKQVEDGGYVMIHGGSFQYTEHGERRYSKR